ncbi:sensor histidine kinase [Planctomycetota bacterium]
MMESTSSQPEVEKNSHWYSRLRHVLVTPSFWLVVGMLVTIGLFHYTQTDLLPSPTNALLSRHAVDRILFLLAIVVATHSFGLWGGLLTLTAVILIILPRSIWISSHPADALIETIAVTVVGYYMIHIITSLAGIAIENARLYERMRFCARQITQAQEDERKRVARELHDDTVQLLIVLSRRIERLAAASETLPETRLERLTSLQEMVGITLQGVRRFIQDLRPPTLDHLGLVAALEGLTDNLGSENIKTAFRVTGDVQRLTPEEELILFRIVQEALSNVRRHSSASQALVQLRFLPHNLRVTIEDNGHGFKVPAQIDHLVSAGKLGLIGMYERARMLSGTLIVQSNPNEGTTITVHMEIP